MKKKTNKQAKKRVFLFNIYIILILAGIFTGLSKLNANVIDKTLNVKNTKAVNFIKSKYIQLDIELLPKKGILKGIAKISYKVLEAYQKKFRIVLNRGLEVKKITNYNNELLEFERDGNILSIKFDKYLSKKKIHIIKIEYVGTLTNETKNRGYSQVCISQEGSFASWVTYWYPMVFDGTSKCTGTIRYTIPKGLKIESSGLFMGAENKGLLKVYTFQVNQPLNFSFAADNYYQQNKVIDGINIGVSLLNGGQRKSDFYINKCSKMIKYFKKVYGFFPFDKYSIVEVNKDKVGNLGGSSEQGMIFIPTGVLPDNDSYEFTISHEIGHSWWGNLVYCDNIVLSEGLSQYTAALWMEHRYGRNALFSLLKNGLNTGSDQHSKIYFYDLCLNKQNDKKIGVNCSGCAKDLHRLANNKGYFVFHMLREEIGKDVFLKGLKNVIKKYRDKKLDLQQFKREMEDVSGQNLEWFFKQWFFRKGAPEFLFKYQIKKINNGYEVVGNIAQKRDVYKLNAEIGILKGNNFKIKKIKIEGKDTSFHFALKEKPEDVVFDPHYKIFRWTAELKKIKQSFAIKQLIGTYQYDKAERLVKELLKEVPNSLDINLMLGNIYMGTKQFSKAEDQFKKILLIYTKYWKGFYSPTIERCKLNLGQINDILGKRNDAINYYKQVLKESIISPGVIIKAKKCLKKRYSFSGPYFVSREKLKTYLGNYQVEGTSYIGYIDKEGILNVKGTNGMEFKMTPYAADKFIMVGNDSISIEYIRNLKNKLVGLIVFRNGKKMFELKKKGKHI